MAIISNLMTPVLIGCVQGRQSSLLPVIPRMYGSFAPIHSGDNLGCMGAKLPYILSEAPIHSHKREERPSRGSV